MIHPQPAADPRAQIFVQIAAYRDPELLPTLRDCLAKAARPERLTFGICWQRAPEDTLGDLAGHPEMRVIDIPWQESQGLGWARAQIQKLWNGEEWTLQLDSHHRFVAGWDELLLEMARQTESPKPIIGSYACPYTPGEETHIAAVPYQMVADTFTSSGTILFRPHTIPNWERLNRPLRARFVSGHFFFTVGQHCEEYRYDPQIYFAGDEISLSTRSFTLGYDLFHPHRHVLWHEYTRQGRTKHWADHTAEAVQQGRVTQHWSERDEFSKRRLRQLLRQEDNGIGLGPHALGTVRSHRDYELYAGIDFLGRRLHGYTVRGEEPPNPFTTDPAWEAAFMTSYNIHASWNLEEVESANDYHFWYFAVEDAQGNVLYRKDMNPDTHPDILAGRVAYIDAAFSSDRQPQKWVLWPVSKSRGWLRRLDRALN